MDELILLMRLLLITKCIYNINFQFLHKISSVFVYMVKLFFPHWIYFLFIFVQSLVRIVLTLTLSW